MTPHSKALEAFKKTMVGEAYTAIDHLLDAELEHCITSYLIALFGDPRVEEAVARRLSWYPDRGNLACAREALCAILLEAE